MNGLERTVTTMHRMLRGEIEPGQAARLLNAPENRLAAYARFVRQHVRTALEKNFTVLPKLIGGVWNQLVDSYFRKHPPRDYELNAAAADFRGFLARLVEEGRYGLTAFHVELAELEWQEWLAYSSEEVVPTPEQVDRPTLNPTLAILDLVYPAADFLDAFRESGDRMAENDASMEPDPQTVFVFRQPRSMNAVFYKADASLLFAFKVVHERLGREEAAIQSGLPATDVSGILARASRLGLIVLPD